MPTRLTIPLVCLLCLLASPLRAQDTTTDAPTAEPTPQAVTEPGPTLLASTLDKTGSRAWSVYRNSLGDHLLVLLAPRDANSSASPPYQASEPGQVQSMRPLGKRMPIAMSATGDRVYMVYRAVSANRQRMMRVYSAKATPSPVGGLWVIDPPDRLDTHDPIITPGDLLDFEASADAIWALVREPDATVLLRAQGGAWSSVPLPEGLDTRRLDLVAIDTDIVLVDRTGTSFHAQRYDAGSQQWRPLPDALPLGGHTRLCSGRRAITAIDWDEQGLARLRSWSPAGVFTVATGIDLPRDAQYGVLDSSETLLGIRTHILAPDPAMVEPTESIELIELDLMNASVRFRGSPVASAPVTAEEFRFLVGMMILIMVGVLVVVILPDRSSVMLLPDGCVLADPGRRLIATLLDAVIVATLVGQVFGVSASEILTLSVIVRPDNAWAVIPATIIAGVFYATAFEYLLSATPGKLITGIRVARAQDGPRTRPGLWSVLVRNIIKWVLPPVAALALIDPETLHRGDRASKTLVVMPRPEQPPASDEPE